MLDTDDNKNNREEDNVIDLHQNQSPEDDMNSIINNIKWSTEHENILADWADQAMCYKWMHGRARIKYNRVNTWFTIPVIIMSTLTGTANFAVDKIPVAYRQWFQIGVGSVNILAGIITTIQQFLKITELNEAHRACTISWDKFYRNVKVELTKNRSERNNPYQMIKSCKEEFDRLIETSPTIPQKIIEDFKKTFSGGKVKDPKNMTPQQRAYELIKKPAICDNLQSTSLSVFKEDTTKKFIGKLITKNTQEMLNRADQDGEDTQTRDNINIIIDDFKREYKRRPSVEEVNDNLDRRQSIHFINNILSNST
jgi:hypothetical protein